MVSSAAACRRHLGTIFQAVLQSDGKIVVVGAFAAVATGTTTSAPRSCVARFDSTGTFDSGYNPGAGMTTADPNGPFAAFAARQSTDKVIVGGFFTQFDGNTVPGIVRLNTNGSYDATFNVGTGPDDINNMCGIYVQDDDQVMAFGNFSAYNGTLRNQIARLGVNGALDAGFAPGVFTNYNSFVTIEAVTKQSDGKYLVGGLFYTLDGNAAGAVARLNSNGSRDPGFDSTGTKTAGEVSCFVKRNADDEYFVGGYFSSYGPDVRNNLVLIKTDGTNDSALPLTTGVIDYNPQIFAISPQTDGKVVVGGLFSSVNGQPHYNLVRLNADGSIDSSFLTTLGASRSVRAFVRQSSGKLLVAGAFYGFDGVTRASVARLNNDGSPDLTFDAGLGAFINSVNAVTVDSSDNVYVGGGFSTFNGVSRPNLVKLTPNGAVDLTFNPGAGPNSTVNALAPPTATAGLVIGGSFNQYNGATANRIARVNATTGALDTAFTTAGGTGFNSTVRALTLRGDGSYYAAGNFATYNGTARGRLARLASNGSLDTGFANPALNLTPRCLVEQNNKIDIAGNFTSPVNQLARYTATGPRDTTLVTGTGLTASELATAIAAEFDAIAVQPDGKLLVGGIFSSYQGMTRFCLVRLSNSHLRITSTALFSGHIRVTGVGDPSTTYSLQAATNPSANSFTEIAQVTTDVSGNWTLRRSEFAGEFHHADFIAPRFTSAPSDRSCRASSARQDLPRVCQRMVSAARATPDNCAIRRC